MAQEYTIYDYWRILRRRKWTIISSVVIVLLATHYFTSRRKPLYRAATTCEVTSKMSYGSEGMAYYIWYAGGMMETETRIAISRLVLEKTLKDLEFVDEDISSPELDRAVAMLENKVNIMQEGDTNILRIEVVTDTPEKAALLANTIAQVYTEVSEWRKKDTNKGVRDFMADQLAYVSDKLRTSEEALLSYKKTGSLGGIRESFTTQLNRLKLDLKNESAKYTQKHPVVMDLKDKIRELEGTLSAISKESLIQTRLQREIQVNEELYFMLNKKYKEMLVASAGEPPRVRVINPAVVPSGPIKPSTPLNFGMGTVVGIIFGIILAFFRENLDTSIGTIEELEEFLKIPVLGVIPFFTNVKGSGSTIDEWKEKARKSTIEDMRSRLAIFQNPKSSIAEAFRTLETNIDFAKTGTEKNTLLFTSTIMKEGKSVTVANFALAAAQSNKKVLLIEADFRAPVLHNIFGVPKENGFSEVLLGKKSITEVVKGTSDFIMGYMGKEKVQTTPGIDDFKLITSGKLPPNPLQLFNSKEFDRFLQEASNMFDLVIFDSSPILPVADPTVISSKVGGVVVVYRVGVVVRGALKRAISQLVQADANVLGVVLNQIRAAEMKSKDTYYRYYHKYYGEEKREEKNNLIYKIKSIFK
ncbi:GumC family protein [Elusimicrobiota bacterium]